MGKKKRVRAQRVTRPPAPVGKAQPRRVWWPLGVGALLVLLGVVALVANQPKHGPAPAPFSSGALTGVQRTRVPWSLDLDRLPGRLQAMGLDALSAEGTAEHIHQHLDIYVNGRHVAVPAGIGIAPGSFISPIHVHDSSGVIHVESPTLRTFTLGEFFGVWGVYFTPRCIGGYCAHGAEQLRLYANGHVESGDISRLPLTSHEELAVVFGAPPARIPSSYSFPGGE